MGSYDPQIISKNKKNCVFSKTCKENKLKNELPPYYLKHSDIGKPQVAFSKSKRFKLDDIDNDIGPGTYDIKPTFP